MIEFLQANFKAITAGVLLFVFLGWETFAPFHRFFGKGKERLVHGVSNVALGLLNGFVIALIFSALWIWAAEFAQARGIGLLHLIPFPNWLAAVVAVLLLDLWTYWWHRWNHEIVFLWRFHSVHHADNRMDVTTANRFHVGEILMSSALRIPVILLIGADFWHVVLYEAVMLPVVQFHHANVGLGEKWDRLLRTVIPTPTMHKVHHSRQVSETNSNYTSLFSFWDRLFRSFNLERPPEEIDLGLEGRDAANYQRVDGMLAMPFEREKKP